MPERKITLTEEDLNELVNVAMAATVEALHGSELIRWEDGVMWVDSHEIELDCDADDLPEVKIVEVEELLKLRTSSL